MDIDDVLRQLRELATEIEVERNDNAFPLLQLDWMRWDAIMSILAGAWAAIERLEK